MQRLACEPPSYREIVKWEPPPSKRADDDVLQPGRMTSMNSQKAARTAPWLGALAKPLVSRESNCGLPSTSVVQALPLRPSVVLERWSPTYERMESESLSTVPGEIPVFTMKASLISEGSPVLRTQMRSNGDTPPVTEASQTKQAEKCGVVEPMTPTGGCGSGSADSTAAAPESEGAESALDESAPDESVAGADTDSAAAFSPRAEATPESGCDDSRERHSRDPGLGLEFMLERPFFGLETILEEEDLVQALPSTTASLRRSLTASRRSLAGPLGVLPDSSGPLQAPEPLSVEMMRPSLLASASSADSNLAGQLG